MYRTYIWLTVMWPALTSEVRLARAA